MKAFYKTDVMESLSSPNFTYSYVSLLGLPNKASEAEGLTQWGFVVSQSGGWKSEVEVSVGRFPLASLLGL